MVTRVKKFKSMNLLGETRAEEKSRHIKVISKAIVSGKTRKQVAKISSLKGATVSQLARRRKILKKAGLKIKKPLTIKQRQAITG